MVINKSYTINKKKLLLKKRQSNNEPITCTYLFFYYDIYITIYIINTRWTLYESTQKMSY